MDSRVLRVGSYKNPWYDADFEDVIQERKRYFQETDAYFMLSADVRNPEWLLKIPENKEAVVVMEGVSMYMTPEENKALFQNLKKHYASVRLLMDAYTSLSAKFTRIANPVKNVGVLKTYGIDAPEMLESDDILFEKEHEMTPQFLIDALTGMEKRIFRKMYAGTFAKKLYRMYEFESVHR